MLLAGLVNHEVLSLDINKTYSFVEKLRLGFINVRWHVCAHRRR